MARSVATGPQRGINHQIRPPRPGSGTPACQQLPVVARFRWRWPPPSSPCFAGFPRATLSSTPTTTRSAGIHAAVKFALAAHLAPHHPFAGEKTTRSSFTGPSAIHKNFSGRISADDRVQGKQFDRRVDGCFICCIVWL
ncbi:uncharacterized protein LOC119324573 [Triticum dicoccoides]|uniref:uncharacterized protein LOC119324573 n=1 Tax=Triticum dicoccoides TaxID=85692 RepID=UPI00188E9047|nr:uncharacterized protein LOC119324573 [Triticum dicoccoides]